MPKWNTHLYVAEQVNDALKYTGREKEEFLLGNVLPDINNGWLVKNVRKRILHDETHICSENEFAWSHFYEKYKKCIQARKPLYMGYLLHLFTDARMNDDYYEAIKGTWVEKEEKDKQRVLKQEDFGKLDDAIGRNGLVLRNIESDVEALSGINEVDVNADDLKLVNEYLSHEDRVPEKEYNFYTEAELLGLIYGISEDYVERFVK